MAVQWRVSLEQQQLAEVAWPTNQDEQWQQAGPGKRRQWQHEEGVAEQQEEEQWGPWEEGAEVGPRHSGG